MRSYASITKMYAHIRSRALNWIQYGFKNAWHYSNPWVSYIEINAEIFFDCISRTLSVWKSWAIQMEYWKWNVRNLWNKTNSAITRFKRKYPTHPCVVYFWLFSDTFAQHKTIDFKNTNAKTIACIQAHMKDTKDAIPWYNFFSVRILRWGRRFSDRKNM